MWKNNCIFAGGWANPVWELCLNLQHALGHPKSDRRCRCAAAGSHARGWLADRCGGGDPASQTLGLPHCWPGAAAQLQHHCQQFIQSERSEFCLPPLLCFYHSVFQPTAVCGQEVLLSERTSALSPREKVLAREGKACANEMLLTLSWLINPQMKGMLMSIVIIINESNDGKHYISLMRNHKRSSTDFWQNLLGTNVSVQQSGTWD